MPQAKRSACYAAIPFLYSALLSAALLFSACTAKAPYPPTPPPGSYTRGPTLYTDDFTAGLSRWKAELESPGSITAHDGILTINVPAGCSLWLDTDLQGPLLIQYDARLIQAGGPNDRVSDLNCFWMATDARNPDFFSIPRTGRFADYNQLRAYYVGQGGNTNSTTRFRRYIGDPTLRPILPEHDLNTHLLTPNQWQTLQLVACNHLIQYFNNGRLIFQFADAEPYTHGYFAFRTTFNHLEIRNFSITRLIPSAEKLAPVDPKAPASKM